MYNPISLIGILGAIIGGYLARHYFGDEGFNWTTIIGAAIGGAVFGGLSQLIIELFNRFNKPTQSVDNVSKGYISSEIEIAQEEVATTTVIGDFKEIPTEVSNKPVYYGFGGWLYLVSIGQLYTLYIALTTIFETDLPLIRSPEWELLTDPQSDVYNAIWEPFIYIEILGCSIFIMIIALIGYLTIRLSKYYKRAQITLYLFNIVYSIIVLILMFALNSSYNGEIYDTNDFLKIIIQTTTASIIWIPYFMFSKRVKNTFNR